MSAFWAIPVMTGGHLLFALLTTGCMLIGIQFGGRDLESFHGAIYRRYREEVPMLVSWRGARRKQLGEDQAQVPATGD